MFSPTPATCRRRQSTAADDGHDHHQHPGPGRLIGGVRLAVELSLLLLALILSVGAYVIVGLAADSEVPSGSAGYGATLAGLFWAPAGAAAGGAWADPILLPGAALLNGLGLVAEIAGSDYAEAAKDNYGPRRRPRPMDGARGGGVRGP